MSVKNWIIFVFTIILNQIGFSQKVNSLVEKTENHQLIKGSNIYIIPPTGFEESEKINGFQDPTDPYSMIVVMEIPGPFNAVSAGFEKEKMLTKSMVLISKKEIFVNSFKGYLIALTQKSGNLNYAKHIIIYGDSSTTFLVNGVFLADSSQLGDRILESINTIYLDKKIEKNPRAELDYTLDESGTDFEFNAVMGNASMFIYKKPHNDIVSYFVDASFLSSKATDKKQFCINRLAQYDQKYQFIKSKGISETVLAGLKGYTLYGQSLLNKNEQIYQTIVFDEDDFYYIFCGIYPYTMPSLIQEFITLNNSFKIK